MCIPKETNSYSHSVPQKARNLDFKLNIKFQMGNLIFK